MLQFSHKRKLANKVIAYMLAISYIVMAVLFIIGGFCESVRMPMFVSVLVIFLLGVLCDFGFSWMISTKMEEKDNTIVAEVTDIMGEKYKYTFKEVKSVHKFLSRYYIKGDIIEKEPRKREKSVSLVYLEDCDENAVNLLRNFSKQ